MKFLLLFVAVFHLSFALKATETVKINIFSPVIEQVAPAVVNIYASKVVRQMAMDPLFKSFPFFGGMGESFLFGMPVDRVQKSLGSGVIIRKNGLIVTNFHVIEGGQEITVVLNDNREFKAKVLISDKTCDLALLKIESDETEFPYVDVRDADELKIGDDVLAIGNPYGIGQSSSRGIVAALARRFGGSKDFRSYIQTDAAVNKGNSGGALIALEKTESGDLKGRLVGVTTAIASTDGGFQGLSFAVPANMIRPLISSYERGLSQIERSWIGIGVQSLDFKMAQSMDLKKPSGVLVTGVYADSPAEKAGFKIGDLITQINGKPVLNDEEYHFRVSVCIAGDQMNLTYKRGSEEKQVTVTLVAPPEKPQRDQMLLKGNHLLSGATVLNLSPSLANELSIDPMKKGVMVFEIKRGSVSHRLGVRPGDIILSYNSQAVSEVKDLKEILSKTAPEGSFDYRRGQKTYSVKVSVDGTMLIQEK